MGRATAANKPDDEWLRELAALECFAGVDVFTEYTRASRWIATHPGRRMNKAFMRNWLSKCPARPMKPASPDYEGTFL